MDTVTAVPIVPVSSTAAPAPVKVVATVGGKHIISGGRHQIIADDTGAVWTLRFSSADGKSIIYGTPDAILNDLSQTQRIKVRGTLVAPNEIGYVDAWSNIRAGEQVFTTIIGAADTYTAPAGATDTIEANLAARAADAKPLFVGDNTNSLLKQSSGWTGAQSQLFQTIEQPNTDAFDKLIADAQAKINAGGVASAEDAALASAATDKATGFQNSVDAPWSDIYPGTDEATFKADSSSPYFHTYGPLIQRYGLIALGIVVALWILSKVRK